MQERMKTHQLSTAEITEVLKQTASAVIATINADGSPYATPIQFVYLDDKLYFHGRAAGQKIDNLRADARVSFTAYQDLGLIRHPEGKPCGTNTRYRSVIAAGCAHEISDSTIKASVLAAIVAKYTPELAGKPLPEATVAKTAVIEITIEQLTGKYY